ncbi:MAG: FecR family protein [Pseudomonadota bacterium]
MFAGKILSGLTAFLVLALMHGAAFAASAGTVAHLSGTLSVQGTDGAVRILSQKSAVNAGDILTTQRDSYAQIDFTDGSSATMRPNTQLKIEAYAFDKDQPQQDNFVMGLLKGGLRTVTGLVGKRGNQDAYRINTSAATIGVRGSSGDTLECSQDCEGVTSTSHKVERGVYHTTYTGLYIMQNDAGSVLIGEGQYAYARDRKTPPVILPGDPGLSLHEMPFTLGIGGGPGSGGGGQECIVR